MRLRIDRVTEVIFVIGLVVGILAIGKVCVEGIFDIFSRWWNGYYVPPAEMIPAVLLAVGLIIVCTAIAEGLIKERRGK